MTTLLAIVNLALAVALVFTLSNLNKRVDEVAKGIPRERNR